MTLVGALPPSRDQTMPISDSAATELAQLLGSGTAGALIPELVRQGLQALIEAEAAAAEAAANAERARVLQPSGAMSASQINQYLTAEKTAQARVQAARANYESQAVRLSQSRVLAPDDGIISAALPVPLEVTDDPCFVLMSATGLLARTTGDILLEFAKKRTSHDTIRSMVRTTARGDVGIVTSFGRVIRQSVVNLPALAEGAAISAAGGAALKEFITLGKGETPISLMALDQPESTLFLTTAFGTVKRVVNDIPGSAGDWNVIRLEEGDYLVGAIQCEDESGEVVLITSDAQLLHFDASLVRATGRPAAGVVGIRLYEGAEVIFGSVVDAHEECLVATVGGEAGALPGTAAHTMKLTLLTEFPGKGRATSGVRCHKFLAGEDVLVAATAGNGPVHACGSTGAAVDVPDKLGKRDSTGTKLRKPVAAVCAAP